MFVRYLTYRGRFQPGDCVPHDPSTLVQEGVITKRSAMQDLVDGKCPDIDAQVSISKVSLPLRPNPLWIQRMMRQLAFAVGSRSWGWWRPSWLW